MTLKISGLQIDPGETALASPGFRKLIEDHKLILRNDISTRIVDLSLHDEHKYVGDFYQLLMTLKVPQDMFWINLHINGLASPLDYNGKMLTILIADRNIILNLLKKYLNTVTIM